MSERGAAKRSVSALQRTIDNALPERDKDCRERTKGERKVGRRAALFRLRLHILKEWTMRGTPQFHSASQKAPIPVEGWCDVAEKAGQSEGSPTQPGRVNVAGNSRMSSLHQTRPCQIPVSHPCRWIQEQWTSDVVICWSSGLTSRHIRGKH